MRNYWIAAAVALLLSSCAGVKTTPPTEVKQALAPTGKLRVAFLANQPVHATKDAATGQLKGVAIDLAQELARRLGVPYEVVTYPTAVALFDSKNFDQWDIIFAGIVPEREKLFDFSAPYVQIEMGFLVRPGAPIAAISDIDKPGVRIAVLQKGASDALLSSTLKSAALVRNPTIADAVAMVKAGEADVLAAIKTFLFPASDQIPGSRVLEGRVAVENIGVGVRKGRVVSAAYVRKFIDEAKATGLVKRAVERASVRGLLMAP
jgi:polar amino acid transport system substrate-binding protein